MTRTSLLWAAIATVVAFFVGSVNPATIVARVLGRDLSASGSGNPGATNAGRVLGVRWGVVVAVLDVLKGLVPAYVALRYGGVHLADVVGVAAVLGHVFSPFLKGRGGKGVATALGAIVGVQPLFGVVIVVVFALVFALGRWVAGASLSAAGTLAVLGVLAGPGLLDIVGVSGGGWWTTAWAVVLAAIVVARHQANIEGWWRARGVARS